MSISMQKGVVSEQGECYPANGLAATPYGSCRHRALLIKERVDAVRSYFVLRLFRNSFLFLFHFSHSTSIGPSAWYGLRPLRSFPTKKSACIFVSKNPTDYFEFKSYSHPESFFLQFFKDSKLLLQDETIDFGVVRGNIHGALLFGQSAKKRHD